jgi:hypothetical protein
MFAIAQRSAGIGHVLGLVASVGFLAGPCVAEITPISVRAKVGTVLAPGPST